MQKPKGNKTNGKFLVIAPSFAKKLKAEGKWDSDYMIINEPIKVKNAK